MIHLAPPRLESTCDNVRTRFSTGSWHLAPYFHRYAIGDSRVEDCTWNLLLVSLPALLSGKCRATRDALVFILAYARRNRLRIHSVTCSMEEAPWKVNWLLSRDFSPKMFRWKHTVAAIKVPRSELKNRWSNRGVKNVFYFVALDLINYIIIVSRSLRVK